MRLLLAGLLVVLAPSVASAECACVCLSGRAVPICSPQALVEPICQQVCVERIEQSFGLNPLAGGGGGGGGGGAPIGSAAGGIDQSTLDAIVGR